MNLLIKVLRSSQRGKQRPWFAHRYTGRFLLCVLCLFIYKFYVFTSPRDFDDIKDSGILKVAYLKSPDTAYEYGRFSGGFELSVIKEFTKNNDLKLELIKTTKKNALTGLNNNQFDVLIGHIPDSRFFNGETMSNTLKSNPWKETSLALVEHKKPKTAKTKRLPKNIVVHAENHFKVGASYNPPFTLELNNNEQPILKQVNNNDIHYALTTANRYFLSRHYFPRTRLVKIIKQTQRLVWLTDKSNESLIKELNAFLSKNKTKQFIQTQTNKLRQKSEYLSFIDISTFKNKRKTVLPRLLPIFQSVAYEENIDWTLITALAYQESKWDVDAVSPTNVKGVMQMTRNTAKILGIRNREDPISVISGAARYLRSLETKIPKRVKREDRIWLAVAAYNLGIGHIINAYKDLLSYGVSSVSWSAVAHQLTRASNQFKNNQYSNGKIAVTYVERIKEFQKLLRYYSSK